MADEPAPRLPRVLAIRAGEGTEAEIDIALDPGLSWFQGHFPGMPILPGVVQIDWALEFARRHLGLGIAAARQFQVKFKATMAPGDRPTLALRHDPGRGRLAFEYRRAGQVCAAGSVTLEAP
ncbi:MAG: hypothetical protein M0006_01705 [Magnetospirillum sp.]|nr:hypothetical protein [Magnetospirillum sp.]